ncbi:MAG TPA: hypothetical protein VGX23_14405 [Actinocrinis sp.]|nr:hypothetical protein [Actinocrinis sp.]
MKTRARLAIGGIAALIAVSGSTEAVAHAAAPGQTQTVTRPARTTAETIFAKGPDVFPHSVAYDAATKSFVVGSLKDPTVSVVGQNGNVRTLVDDPRLISTQGVALDLARNRVLVTNVDYGFADGSASGVKLGVAGVASYNLSTGARQWYVDLTKAGDVGPQHLVSDVVVAPDGTAYAVDGLTHTIFRIDRQGHASVFLDSDLLAGTVDVSTLLTNLGATALSLVPGHLLIVTKADGTLVRVPLDHPDRATLVRLNTNLVPLVAAETTLPDGSIATVSSGLLSGNAAVVERVCPSNDWTSATATVTDTVTDPVTSGISAGPDGSTYTLSGGIAQLLGGEPNSGFFLRPVQVGSKKFE